MKRILTVCMTTLLLMAALCVTASASDYDAAAEDLSAIGIFRGTSAGFDLDRAPTRSEAAIMLVRLYGAEDSAKADYEAGKISHPFTDVSKFASPYVAWVYEKGLSKGTSATTFGSANACSAKMYTAFLLRALGYQDGTDFVYADTLPFAQEKGLFDTSMISGTFLRDDLAAITYQALACDLKDGSSYLLDSLVKSGAIDAKAASPITEKIQTYRALEGTVGSAMGSSLDTDMDMKMTMDMSVTSKDAETGKDVTEQDTMDMSGKGNVKMIMDKTGIQMAMDMTSTALGESTSSKMWMKDGWVYSQTGDTSYKYEVADEMAAYESLMQQGLSQMNVSMLPMIDSITAKKSGGDTVYTLVMGDSIMGMVDDLMGLVGTGGLDELGINFSMDQFSCAYTYTVSSNNTLKSATALMDMQMKMNLDDGSADAMSLAAKIHADVNMDVKATGENVKIVFPDFSKFELLDPTAAVEPAA